MIKNLKNIHQLLVTYLVIVPLFLVISFIDCITGVVLALVGANEKLKYSQQAEPANAKSAYRSGLSPELDSIEDVNTNLYNELAKSVKKHGHSRAIGVRTINSVENVKQNDEKLLKKISQGPYEWNTYDEVFARINNLSMGLLSLGLKSNDNIVLFAETRSEWLVSAFACFKIKVPVVTLYASLGECLAYLVINIIKT